MYLDTRTQRNITRLQTDVQEVASIMTRNIADILGQGERMSGAALLSFYACTPTACISEVGVPVTKSLVCAVSMARARMQRGRGRCAGEPGQHSLVLYFLVSATVSAFCPLQAARKLCLPQCMSPLGTCIMMSTYMASICCFVGLRRWASFLYMCVPF